MNRDYNTDNSSDNPSNELWGNSEEMEKQAREALNRQKKPTEQAGQTTSNARDQIEQTTSTVSDQAAQTMNNPGTQTPQPADNFTWQGSQTMNNIRDQAAQTSGNIGNQAAQASGDIRNQANQTIGNIRDQAGQSASNIRSQADSAISNVRDQATQGASNLSNQVTQARDTFTGQSDQQTGQPPMSNMSQQTGQPPMSNPDNQPATGTPTQSATPTGPFTAQEWKILQDTPLKVGRAMIIISPSGPIGLVQEAMALGKQVQTIMGQSEPNALLSALGGQLRSQLEAAKSGGQNPFADLINSEDVKNPEFVRNDALTACQQAAMILRKIPQGDASAYKQFVFGIAQNVASAASEGGFLGFGGQQVSENEQALLRDIASTLGYQPS